MKSRNEDREEVELLLKHVGSFHEHDLDLPTRTIFMGSVTVDADGMEGGVDAKMAERFLKNIHLLERLSPNSPVRVLMDNLGGDEYHGLAIFDAIKLSPCEVTIVVRGYAMSMGSILLQAADRRVMGPRATQMVHYGTWGGNGHAKTMQRWARECERLDEWMEELYLERIREKKPRFSLEALRGLLDHDTFFTAVQSVELGLADVVG